MPKLVSRSGPSASSACAETWQDEKVDRVMRRADEALVAPSAGSPRARRAHLFGSFDGAEGRDGRRVEPSQPSKGSQRRRGFFAFSVWAVLHSANTPEESGLEVKELVAIRCIADDSAADHGHKR